MPCHTYTFTKHHAMDYISDGSPDPWASQKPGLKEVKSGKWDRRLPWRRCEKAKRNEVEHTFIYTLYMHNYVYTCFIHVSLMVHSCFASMK